MKKPVMPPYYEVNLTCMDYCLMYMEPVTDCGILAIRNLICLDHIHYSLKQHVHYY